MSDFTSLKHTLKRGALIAGANWPVVLVQFVAESTFKLLLGVPIVGGALLVALALGRDIGELLRGSPREILTRVGGALMEQPGAFSSFVLALLLMVLGGSTLMFLLKGGTLTVLVQGAEAGGAIEQPPLRLSTLRQGAAFSIDTFIDGSTRLFRRFLRLGLLLLGTYALSGAAYLLAVIGAYRLATATGLLMAWTLIAALASSVLIVWITILNLVYLLTQMAIAVEDCSVREGFRRALTFIRVRFRSVLLVFVVVLALVVLATIGSLLATAGLGVISFVPLVGIAVLPLQAAAWLVRGIVFQFLGLTAFGGYLAIYRAAVTAPAGELQPAWARTVS